MKVLDYSGKINEYIGIDLGLRPETTGIALSKQNRLYVMLAEELGEESVLRCISRASQMLKPKSVVAVDAPLSIPFGRKSLEERGDAHLRECDLMLREMKIRFFPITLGAMRKLTRLGIEVKEALEKRGFEVIETFPGACYSTAKKNRKSLSERMDFLKKWKIRTTEEMSTHEIDALTCWLCAKHYAEKSKYVVKLEGRDGKIYFVSQSSLVSR